MRGDTGALKLIDFGMAAHVTTVVGRDERGSPSYMAPELRGPPRDGGSAAWSHDLFKADVFSLGVTLYIMVVGSMPWGQTYRLDAHFNYYKRLALRAAGGGVVRSFVARGSPAIAAGLSHRLVSLLDACLALEPERRPTAAALLEQPWFDPTAEDEDGE